MESIFRNIIRENTMRTIFFLMQNSVVNFKKLLFVSYLCNYL